jgi:LmbE family N-acetylglucosaminyl deacetylase
VKRPLLAGPTRAAVLVLGVLAAAACRRPLLVPRADVPRLHVHAGERLLVVAPHPDDETIGAGGLIERVLARGGLVRVVLVTAGDGYVEAVTHATGELTPRAPEYLAYGERRLGEARHATTLLAARAPARLRLQALGFPDGGLLPLLHAHWSRHHPEQSSTTGATHPPYAEAVDRDAVYAGEDLEHALARLIGEVRPTIIALPDPLDRHPDHHAAGIFTLLALDDRRRRGAPLPDTRLLAYLVHWPSWPPGWDGSRPLPVAARAQLALPTDLPPHGVATLGLELTDGEVAGKRAALAAYASQQEVMPALLAAFVRADEPFVLLRPAAGGGAPVVPLPYRPRPLPGR